VGKLDRDERQKDVDEDDWLREGKDHLNSPTSLQEERKKKRMIASDCHGRRKSAATITFGSWGWNPIL